MRKGREGTFPKSLFPSIPLLWHRTFILREMDGLRLSPWGRQAVTKAKLNHSKQKLQQNRGVVVEIMPG